MKAIREEKIEFKIEIPMHMTLRQMRNYSKKVVETLPPINKNYLVQRQELVDWLSGVGDNLNISNAAVHHAVCVLDIFSCHIGTNFDV